MLAALLLALSQAVPEPAPGPAFSGRDGQLQVAIPRLDAAIDVDGQLDEPAWSQAARLTGFSAYAPVDGREAEETTEVLVFYSATAIHFAARAQAAPGSVRATLANRDHLDTEDQLRLFLSTFDDGRQAFYFAVNPLGVQADGTLVEGVAKQGNGFDGLATGREDPDLNPDFVFESKGRLTPEGWQVELRIPFKTLRYPSQAPQSWGLHVTRMRQSRSQEDSWVPARRAAASFLAQAGKLTGLTDLRRGLVLDLTPEVTGRLEGAPQAAPGQGWDYSAGHPEAGGTVRWGVTPDLTVNGTANPDFSQVEADAGQFSFDPRSALFYDEKRPFFLDGSEQFATPNRLIYTRRIVDPIGAAKVSGKLGPTSLAFLTALDASSQSKGAAGHPFFGLMRVQRDLGERSKAALVATDREDGADWNRVVAADARLGLGQLWSLRLQGALSDTRAAGRDFSGPLWEGILERNGRRFGLRWQATGISPDFRTESGFIARGNVANVTLDQRWTFFGGEKSRLASLSTDVVLNGVWRYQDFPSTDLLERKLHWNNNAVFNGGWKAGAAVLIERFDYDPDLYADYALLAPDGSLQPFVGVPWIRNLDWLLSVDTPRFSGFSASGFWLWGHDENFFEWSSSDIDYLDVSLDYRPTEQLRLEGRYQLQLFDRRSDGSNVAVRHIPRLKLEYQLSRAIFLRFVGEYDLARQDDLRDDGRTELPIVIRDPETGAYELASGSEQKRLRLDVLFSYQPVPGTVLFVGYGSQLRNLGPGDELQRSSDGFFVKLSWLFRL